MQIVLWAIALWGATSFAVAPMATETNRFARMSDEAILRVAGVPRHHWAADAIIRLYRLGVLQGYPEKRSHPRRRGRLRFVPRNRSDPAHDRHSHRGGERHDGNRVTFAFVTFPH
ncbi:MAG: S-layer homology domain-containing protein [Abditibacteriales bacterium]|nr:S-layer homology domain-containing protein [Abditibacteriales bacterium]MDW8365425.1 S-layer homology domain-containing protein [Abditibacteriales bacterium]